MATRVHTKPKRLMIWHGFMRYGRYDGVRRLGYRGYWTGKAAQECHEQVILKEQAKKLLSGSQVTQATVATVGIHTNDLASFGERQSGVSPKDKVEPITQPVSARPPVRRGKTKNNPLAQRSTGSLENPTVYDNEEGVACEQPAAATATYLLSERQGVMAMPDDYCHRTPRALDASVVV